MTPESFNPFVWFALALAGWGLWRLLRWVASGGRLPLRGRRGSAAGFTAAGLSSQQFYQPSARQALETQLREALRREEDDEGDPPEPRGASTSDPREGQG
jgi:hypothetical protein